MNKLKIKGSFLKNNLLLFIIISAAFFIAIQRNDSQAESEKIHKSCSLTLETVQSFIPETDHAKLIDENCFFSIFDNSGDNLGILLNTPSETNDPSGFGGKLEVFVLIDDSNKISGVFQGKNSETGSYISMLKDRNFYKNWNGLKAQEALEKEVDTVTGATVSSNAVIQMVKKNLNLYKGKANYKLSENKSLGFSSTAVMLFFVFSLIFFFFPGKTKKFRTILLVLSILIPGVLAAKFSSMEIFENWLKNGLSISSTAVFIITISSILLSVLKKRNIYCCYYCPMGALQEMIYKTPLPKLKIRPLIIKTFSYIRSIFLLLLIIFMLTELFDDYSVFEPFSAFRINAAAISSIILLISSTILSIFTPKPWCKLCPTGKVFDMLANFRKTEKILINNTEKYEGDMV